MWIRNILNYRFMSRQTRHMGGVHLFTFLYDIWVVLFDRCRAEHTGTYLEKYATEESCP